MYDGMIKAFNRAIALWEKKSRQMHNEARTGHLHYEAFVEERGFFFFFGHKGSEGKLSDPAILGTYLSVRYSVIQLMHSVYEPVKTHVSFLISTCSFFCGVPPMHLNLPSSSP